MVLLTLGVIIGGGAIGGAVCGLLYEKKKAIDRIEEEARITRAWIRTLVAIVILLLFMMFTKYMIIASAILLVFRMCCN